MNKKKMKANVLAVVAGVFLLASPTVRAQEAAADDGAGSAGGSTAKATAQPASTNKEPTTAPAAAPVPGPAAAGENSSGDPASNSGGDYPRWEAFLGYSLLNARFGSGISAKDANGGSGSLAYNLNRWVGLVADFGGYDFGTITVPATPGGPVHLTGVHAISYLFGPRLNYRFGNNNQHNVFGQVLVGGAHTNLSLGAASTTKNAFAMAAGGGVDIGLTKHVAWRLAQLEYVLTDFDYDNGYKPQNNLRFSTGVLFRWGGEKPPAPKLPPTATCSADASTIMQGSGGSVPVRANASSPEGYPLTYAWSASGGRVEGSGPTARWIPGDAVPGSYTITARVDDGHGGTASCSANVNVEPKPAPRPPRMSCSVDRTSVLPGEVVNVMADAASPEGFPLDYSWRASGGRVSGSGARVQLDTSGLAPGDYSVTGRVTDGHGGAADCVAGLRVNAPPPKPQATKLGECIFKPGSTRVDNQCSRLLDDAVVRLQNDPKSTLVLIGYGDPAKEKKGKVAETRAVNAKKYVTQGKGKGTARVDAGRVSTRAESGVAGADTANRRVDIFQVPEGAVF